MSSGYLYELRRKSEDFESSQRSLQHEHLKSCSEEEDNDIIWGVPEESFDNAYQTIEEQEDEDEDDKAGKNVEDISPTNINPSNILQNFEIFSAHRLRLSLSAEQISLKSQQQKWDNAHQAECQRRIINKSINTETDVPTRPTVIVSSNSSSASTTNSSSIDRCHARDNVGGALKWKNIKINNKTKENEQTALTQLSAIPLIPLVLNQALKEMPPESQIVPEINLSLKKHTVKCSTYTNDNNAKSSPRQNEKCRKFSWGSVSMQRPHIDLGPQADYCTSPESIVDNVLSNASSVSVQSSSLSSDILKDDGEQLKLRTTNPFILDNQITGNNMQGQLIDYTDFISDTKSPLSRCSHQVAAEHPSITITKASPSNSMSIMNNGAVSVTSSESYETATTTTSRHPFNPISDPLVIHASSPEPPQYPEEVLCAICGEIFKDPRCLNCLHTFCLQCIVNENFKDDECNDAFWVVNLTNPGMTFSIQNNESAARASSSSTGSSTSLEAKGDSGKINAALASSQKLRSSFSFRLKRPSDSPIKTTSDSSRSFSDNSTTLDRRLMKTHLLRKITCKICQNSMDVPAGGIKQLPQDLMVVRKIHEFQFKLKQPGNSCSLCYDETNASYHCDTCSVNLCTLCKESHTRQKTTADHDIKHIKQESKNDERQKNNSDIKLKCHLHQGFDVKSFCIQCLQVACSDCLVLQHKGHKYESIPKASQCYARHLRESTDQARLLLKNTEHSMNKLNEFSENVNQKCDILQAEVEDFMGKYLEALEAHKCVLLHQIDAARQTKLNIISKQQKEIEKHNHEAMTAIKFSQELIDVASGGEILTFIKILLRRFDQLQQFRCPVDSKMNSTPNFVAKIQAAPCKEYKEIPVFGIITTQTVEPAQCTLQWNGFSQLRLHKKVELTLISRDANGLPISHGGLKIQSHVKYKDVNSKCLRIEINDNNDGTYSISFTPDTEGTIILMITINDRHIKGSPFSFLSRPVRPHSGIYHCCTFCSSKGNKFATCSCDGHMPGYSGCGHGHTGHPGHRHWSCCGDVSRISECQFSNRSLNPK